MRFDSNFRVAQLAADHVEKMKNHELPSLMKHKTTAHVPQISGKLFSQHQQDKSQAVKQVRERLPVQSEYSSLN